MESRLQPRSTSRSDRYYRSRRAAFDAFPMTSTLVAVFFSLVVLQIVSNTDQAALNHIDVVRVVRVDVPPVVRSYDAKPDPAAGGSPPPLLLGCVYALEGGENDDENGDVVPATHPPLPANGSASAANSARDRRSSSPAPDLAMDAAMEQLQKERGLVVKWYFRRNPVPAVPDDAMMAIINDNEQVYQWIAGGGPEAGGGLGPLSGRTVDVTAETPRTDRSFLHRVLLVERPTAELTGEYRCQVEDWNSERRSAWHPMVVYTPERIFKISVDDNDDDDEDDIAEGSGGDVNFTTLTPPTSSSAAPTGPKNWPTEINITCYAAGMHPEPSMSIWVNGVPLDSVTSVVTEDDGDDDETNDGVQAANNATMTPSTTTATTTTTTTTAKPKSVYRNNRYRSGNRDAEYKKYAVRATSVVSLKDAEEYRNRKPNQHHRRRNTVDVECRLRVPGDGAGDGYWKADRPPGRYYAVRKSVAYKYRNDVPPPGDPFAAVSSASSVADDDDDSDSYGADRGANGASNGQDADGQDDAESAATSATAAASFFVVVAAAAATAAADRR
ncbi:uncharacterized protein LOC114133081 [Aphis gossypii]|uniref:uncharacterized protein LOC114133081 n=1 Tax=Aphis gossypii TaxID=80765 RepID=UPI00215940D4|nr:uncharacterized protein LOC114133081 [Aphis gossypii]